LSDGQQFHQYQQKSPLTSSHWVMVNNSSYISKFVDIDGIVDHHSMSLGERWFLLILVELLTIIQWVEVRGDFCWYWWNCWPYLNSLSDGQQFPQYKKKSPLTLTHWVMVSNSTNISKNPPSPQLFVDIGGIVDHHSMSWGEGGFLLILVELLRWSTIPSI
jgi:hypothetical protein